MLIGALFSPIRRPLASSMSFTDPWYLARYVCIIQNRQPLDFDKGTPSRSASRALASPLPAKMMTTRQPLKEFLKRNTPCRTLSIFKFQPCLICHSPESSSCFPLRRRGHKLTRKNLTGTISPSSVPRRESEEKSIHEDNLNERADRNPS